MGIDPKDYDLFQLLKKLKEVNGSYPQELLALRRQRYLAQVAEVSGGIGLAVGLKNTLKNGGKVGYLPLPVLCWKACWSLPLLLKLELLHIFIATK